MSADDHRMDAATDRAEELFCTALEIASDDDRSAYLCEACGGDEALREAVERLLATQVKAEDFFREDCPTKISAAEITETLAESPELLEDLDSALPDDGEVGKQIGFYRLLRKIGEGGCGNVYLAEQEKPVRRQVAFKIIKLGMDTKNVIARFEAERQALAMMEHPNIAHVLNAGETETGRPFFVMELVHGVKVTTFCEENDLTIHERLELFIQVCHAIQHAHQKGIIHRDIKPSNVLITMHDGMPMPKVIDFGIAKATSGDLLPDGTVDTALEPLIGTPAYMSPEQADRAQMDIDMRSDIYSLGILLYELLVGKTPFDQKELLKSGLDEMRHTLRQVEPPRPAAKLGELPPDDLANLARHRRMEPRRLTALLGSDLAWIVMKAMEKDRDRRYQTADGLAEDVRRYIDSEPVVARPPSRRYRLRKMVRRNKGVFASVGAVSLTLVIGLGTSSWLFIKEREARNEVERARQNEAQLRLEAETRAKIAQAAVLLSRGQPDEADKLVGDCQVPVIQPSLEAATVFRRLGDWHVTQGRWPEAADRLLKLAQANRVDQADMTDAATRDLLRVAPALVAAGDHSDYGQLIEGTIKHFEGTTDPVAAEHVIKISVILPTDGSVLAALEPLAAVVEQSVAEEHAKSGYAGYMAAWRVFALACYEYRRGDFAKALARAREGLSYADATPSRMAMTHVVLSMALSQLDQPGAARSELARGREMIESRFPRGQGGFPELGGEDSGFWHDWLLSHILLKEATLLTQKSLDKAPGHPGD